MLTATYSADSKIHLMKNTALNSVKPFWWAIEYLPIRLGQEKSSDYFGRKGREWTVYGICPAFLEKSDTHQARGCHQDLVKWKSFTSYHFCVHGPVDQLFLTQVYLLLKTGLPGGSHSLGCFFPTCLLFLPSLRWSQSSGNSLASLGYEFISCTFSPLPHPSKWWLFPQTQCHW